MSDVDFQEDPVFKGRTPGGISVEEFIRVIRKHAVQQGKSRDNEYIADYAMSCLVDDALHWAEALQEEVTGDWALLRRALLDEYGVGRTTTSEIVTPQSTSSSNVPTPAAAPPPPPPPRRATSPSVPSPAAAAPPPPPPRPAPAPAPPPSRPPPYEPSARPPSRTSSSGSGSAPASATNTGFNFGSGSTGFNFGRSASSGFNFSSNSNTRPPQRQESTYRPPPANNGPLKGVIRVMVNTSGKTYTGYLSAANSGPYTPTTFVTAVNRSQAVLFTGTGSRDQIRFQIETNKPTAPPLASSLSSYNSYYANLFMGQQSKQHLGVSWAAVETAIPTTSKPLEGVTIQPSGPTGFASYSFVNQYLPQPIALPFSLLDDWTLVVNMSSVPNLGIAAVENGLGDYALNVAYDINSYQSPFPYQWSQAVLVFEQV